MPRSQMLVLGTASLVVVIGLGIVVGKQGLQAAEQGEPAQQVRTKPTTPVNVKPAEKPNADPADKATVSRPVVAKPSADEEAIRLTGQSFVKAYATADARAVAAHYTPDAEFIDEQGNVFRGRTAIQEVLDACFTANPGARMEMEIFSIRFISPVVAIEDGTTAVISANDDAEPIHMRYTAVHVKTDGKWLTASVREQAPKERRRHRIELQQLAWLQGDWVDEGAESLVIFSCGTADGGNFLLRKFTIQIAGQESLSGTQRIGWDPLTGKLRTWIFDSEGGFSDGLWHRDGNRWVLKSTGVTADGEPASSTTIYTLVNEHTMTWQSIHHEVAGVQLPDSEVVKIVRRAPAPLSVDDGIPLSKSE